MCIANVEMEGYEYDMFEAYLDPFVSISNDPRVKLIASKPSFDSCYPFEAMEHAAEKRRPKCAICDRCHGF